MSNDEVIGSQFRAHRSDDAYVRVDWVDGAHVEVRDAAEAIEAVVALWPDPPAPVLVDMRGARSITRQARQTFADPPKIARTALYVDSPLGRTMANFFIAVSDPRIPIRLFTDLDEARRWLIADG